MCLANAVAQIDQLTHTQRYTKCKKPAKNSIAFLHTFLVHEPIAINYMHILDLSGLQFTF